MLGAILKDFIVALMVIVFHYYQNFALDLANYMYVTRKVKK